MSGPMSEPWVFNMFRNADRKPFPPAVFERGQCPAFTQIELVVVIAIAGGLVALLLPAVQQARATARKTQCANNLKQIGFGLHSFAEVNGYFPTGQECMVRISPYLESGFLLEDWTRLEWGRSMHRRMPWLICPADPLLEPAAGVMSYAVNGGGKLPYLEIRPGFAIPISNGFRQERRFTRFRIQGITPAMITDGLSQSLAFSERLSGIPGGGGPRPASSVSYPRRVLWFTERRFLGPGEEALTIDQCRHHRLPEALNVVTPAMVYLCPEYNHLLPPNHPGCALGPNDGVYTPGAIKLPTATSLHHGGVNALVADGAVRFVNDGIDPKVWGALGSVADRDPVAGF